VQSVSKHTARRILAIIAINSGPHQNWKKRKTCLKLPREG